MGTNYYHEVELCDKCHNSTQTHIGKSSAGWTFSFHATDDIRSWKEWQAKLAEGGRIVDEYGDAISLDDFKLLVERKRLPWGKQGVPPLNATTYSETQQYPRSGMWLDPEGESFSEGEFS